MQQSQQVGVFLGAGCALSASRVGVALTLALILWGRCFRMVGGGVAVEVRRWGWLRQVRAAASGVCRVAVGVSDVVVAAFLCGLEGGPDG